MVSAICPTCKILLVEADDNFSNNLGTAVNQAVAQGARFVSNSYGGDEGPDESQDDDAYYHHDGVAITASSGDAGYGTSYPAASPFVTAVGGTTLDRDGSARGWTESVWNGAGSGCSAYEAKPSFQQDNGCANRTIADVSAVADTNTGVAVYNGGWQIFGGTSVSAPIIAAVYALAGVPAAGSAPNSVPYEHPSDLNDVTSGNNVLKGVGCGPAYLCTGGGGYDGPSGLGTPHGVAAFRTGPRGLITGTVTDGTAPLASARVKAGDLTGMTDGQGHYSLSVPPGTYDVTASKLGYTSKTVTGVQVDEDHSVTENFALTVKAARVNISGLVRDGSGHGWPLYAAVRVKDEPTAVAYTDPKTGRYTLTVPADDTYTLQVDPLYPGYARDTHDVQVGYSPVVHNVDVTVDPTCSAAGYAPHPTAGGSTESFDGTTAPAGWTVDDQIGNGQTWVFDDPGGRGNQTGGSGNFAIIDSAHYGTGNGQNSSLVSPVMDFGTRMHPVMSFATNIHGPTRQTSDVDLSIDGGATWTNVKRYNLNLLGPSTETVDLSAAAGKSAVRVRFHFYTAFGTWWQVDDVFFGDRTCDPTPGSLIVGRVTDKNTGAGVNGAMVTSVDQPAEKATTAATPDDPNLGDGLYSMFSTLTGPRHEFTGTRPNYGSGEVTANIAADRPTAVDIALPAPRIAVAPTSIAKTVGWQKSVTATVIVKNSGTAPVTAKIGEQPSGVQPAAKGAPLQRVPGHFVTGPLQPDKTDKASKSASVKASVTSDASPWTAIADYPTPVADSGVAMLNGDIYSVGGADNHFAKLRTGYVYDPETQAWSAIPSLSTAREAPQATAVGGKLYVTGGWGGNGSHTVPATEIFNPATNTWSAGAPNPKPFAGAPAAVVGGKIYIVGGCTDTCGTTDVQIYDPSTNTWSSGPDYPESTAWLGCGGINGKLYCAGGFADASGSTMHGYVLDPAMGTWTPIADLPVDLWGMGYSTANGTLIFSGGVTGDRVSSDTLTNQGFAYSPDTDSWTALPNSNNVVYRAGAACGFYKIGGNLGVAFPSSGSEVLPGYDQCDTSDVPWLSEDRTEVTLQPGQTTQVNLTLDAGAAAITQPGTRTARIVISAKTPYQITPVNVTMTVNPPKTSAKSSERSPEPGAPAHPPRSGA
jgi:hypothetical protein